MNKQIAIIKQNYNRKLLWFCFFVFSKYTLSRFHFWLSLLPYFLKGYFQKSAPGRGVAAEEFCVFGDWGIRPNKHEKPER